MKERGHAVIGGAIAALLGMAPATARATGSGLEYVVFLTIGLGPAVLILFGLIIYAVISDRPRKERKSLVVTYVATSALACTALLLFEALPYEFSMLVWIGPLAIVFFVRILLHDEARA